MLKKPQVTRTKRPTTNKTPRPKLGRPPTRHGVYDPPRILGRVSNQDWELIKLAADDHRNKTGEGFTKWAVDILLKASRNQLTSNKQKLN